MNATAGSVARTQNLAADAATSGTAFDAIVQALPEPALLVDGKNRLIAGNVAAAALFGRLRTNEAISLTTRNPQILEALAKAASGEQQNLEIEERLRRDVSRHPSRVLEVVVVVRPVAAHRDGVGKGLPEATGPAYPLLVVEPLRRHVRHEGGSQ